MGMQRREETLTNDFFDNDDPRAGRKGDIRDGAFHVPAIARWPGRIEADQTSGHIWAMWDFLPTAAELIKVNAPDKIDGISILPTLLGDAAKQEKHDFLYWEYKSEQAVRVGRWYGYKNREGALEVYDLIKNPDQDTDLSTEHPDIAQKVEEIMQEQHTPSDVWPSPGESEEDFQKRMMALGIDERPKNVAEF